MSEIKMKENSGKYEVNNCCAIILAAGQSKRLGNPKQLLEYQAKTLLQHAIDCARKADLTAIVVVLGSNEELIKRSIDVAGVTVVSNTNWQAGMASSIVCGINAVKKIEPVPDSVILMVCDQPFVNEDLIGKLLTEQRNTGKLMVASRYQEVTGTPALFHQSLFEELAQLEGDAGARKLINQYPDDTALVQFPEGSIDIDTLGDYQKLVS